VVTVSIVGRFTRLMDSIGILSRAWRRRMQPRKGDACLHSRALYVWIDAFPSALCGPPGSRNEALSSPCSSSIFRAVKGAAPWRPVWCPSTKAYFIFEGFGAAYKRTYPVFVPAVRPRPAGRFHNVGAAYLVYLDAAYSPENRIRNSRADESSGAVIIRIRFFLRRGRCCRYRGKPRTMQAALRGRGRPRRSRRESAVSPIR
jgi:hypothetical protein